MTRIDHERAERNKALRERVRAMPEPEYRALRSALLKGRPLPQSPKPAKEPKA